MKILLPLFFILTSSIFSEVIMNYPNALNKQLYINEEEKKTFSVKIKHENINKLLDVIKNLYPKTTFLIHPTDNVLIIKSSKNIIEPIKETISKLNQKEQIIEFSIQIYEISSQNQKLFEGILEPFQSGLNYNQVSKTILPTEQVTNLLKNLKIEGNASLKANPILKVKNNKIASFKVGDLIPYLTKTNTSNSEYTSLNHLETGINLELHPKIIDLNKISCTINFDMTMIKLWKTLNSSEYPILSFRKINTTVNLNHSESLILAGLIDEYKKKNKNTLFFLNKIPILKNIFNHSNEELLTSDVCIVVTPKILN